jgi:hypothetical protein
MIAVGNYAPGNAGPIFYTDIIIPIIGLTLLWLEHKVDPAARMGSWEADKPT